MKSIYGLERQPIEGIAVAIRRVLESKDFILGHEVNVLQDLLARYTGRKHAIAVSSGTDAQFLILKALGIGAGDVVFVPDFTFVSTASVVKMVGATPIFVDVDPADFTMNPEHLLKMIQTPQGKGKPRAVIPVSTFGCAYSPYINDIAKDNGLVVIEDACHSLGTPLQAPTAFTSFYPTKPLGGFGDSGMIFTDDPALSILIKYLRDHYERGKGLEIGYNCRMDTIQAAIILEKLTDYADHLRARSYIADIYREGLDRQKYFCQSFRHTNNAYFSIRCRENRDKVIFTLSENRIPYGIYYRTPLHKLRIFWEDLIPAPYPIASAISMDILQLPMNPYIRRDEAYEIAKILNGVK
jgi:UDP-2-acetamido-2-deoxy-ribo-hexuluronate aminotransferase